MHKVAKQDITLTLITDSSCLIHSSPIHQSHDCVCFCLLDMGSFRSGGAAEVRRTNDACAPSAGQICCGEVVSAGVQEVDETVGGAEAS